MSIRPLLRDPLSGWEEDGALSPAALLLANWPVTPLPAAGPALPEWAATPLPQLPPLPADLAAALAELIASLPPADPAPLPSPPEEAVLLARQLAQLPPVPPPPAPPAPAAPEGEVALHLEIRDLWWGGFRAELTVTAEGEVAGWQAVLHSRWTLRDAFGAVLARREETAEGSRVTLADAGWNAALADGESATVVLVGETGEPGLPDRAALLDGIWPG